MAYSGRGFTDYVNQSMLWLVIGHSMGIYVLRHALLEIKNFMAERIPRIFDQILIMAADEDDDAFDFDYKLQLLAHLTRRTSVYFNRDDLALWASNSIKGNLPRLRSDGPLQPRQLPRNVYPIDGCVATGALYYFSIPSLEMTKKLREDGYRTVLKCSSQATINSI